MQQSSAPRFYSDLIPGQTRTLEIHQHSLLWTLKFHCQHLFRCRELDCTSSQADNGPQAVPLPHDDGGQDLAPQEAVLDACRQCVETLVTQHGDLVMQRAAGNRKLQGRGRISTFTEGWPHNCAHTHKKCTHWKVSTSAGISSPVRAALSASPIRTRRAASAASCLPCFLLDAHTGGNQRPPSLAW